MNRTFLCLALLATATGLTITWQSVAGQTYAVERSLDLQSWATIGSIITATGAQTSFIHA